jgi:polysaccharide biosynthesis/export protein
MVSMRMCCNFATIFTFAVGVLSAGCSIMPASGPESYDVRASQVVDPQRLPYGLVRLTPAVVDVLARNAPRLSSYFADRRPPGEIRFGVGDVVSVTIFEAAAGGLFIPSEASVRPGNFITLPNQAVDSKGNISVPYAGVIRATGHTAVEVQQSIVDALEERAIKPQVLVSLVEQRTSLISVLGEVNRPERFPASAAGEHILDAITRAGGPRAQGFDTWIMLEREGHRATVPFGALVYEPANNVYVHPNDTIYLYREPQTFVAFGAVATGGTTTGGQGQYNFDAWRLSLAEAVAKAGGLSDSLADPASVFLYRGEVRPVAEQLGIDGSKFQGPIIPVIYNVNFRDPAGYFLATRFQMRNKDVIYVSNAVSVETSKFLTYLRLIMATADDPIIYATSVYTLKAATKGTATATTLLTSPAIVTPTP